MYNLKKLKFRDEKGQGMTEYIVIVALIAVASIAVVTMFGDQLRELFAGSANELAGQSATIDNHTTTAQDEVSKTLGGF